MMRLPILCLCVALGACAPPGATDRDGGADEQEIRAVIDGLTTAWTAGDAEAWASYFSDDADFTVWFGLRMSGREEIAWGHGIIFESFYSNTIFDLEIDKLRFPAHDVAVVQLSGRVIRPGMPEPTEPEAVPLAVLQRTATGWEIINFQNTPQAANELRQNGDLAQFRAWAESLGASSR